MPRRGQRRSDRTANRGRRRAQTCVCRCFPVTLQQIRPFAACCGLPPGGRILIEANFVMRAVLERSNLLKSLNHVHRVVERRNTIPILSNVLLSATGASLELKATDL